VNDWCIVPIFDLSFLNPTPDICYWHRWTISQKPALDHPSPSPFRPCILRFCARQSRLLQMRLTTPLRPSSPHSSPTPNARGGRHESGGHTARSPHLTHATPPRMKEITRRGPFSRTRTPRAPIPDSRPPREPSSDARCSCVGPRPRTSSSWLQR
jgi:hypothetical protein